MKPDERDRRLDQLLDAGLRQLGSAEPRPGLEMRIRAILNAEQVRVSARLWPRIAVWTTVLAMVLGALWAPRRKQITSSTRHEPRSVPPAIRGERNVALELPPRRAAVTRSHSGKIARAASSKSVAEPPRLEQFPSPLPLTEQERDLADYVRRFHRQAAMEARARTEWLERQAAELSSDRESDHAQD